MPLKPWNQREPILSALERWGLLEAFQAAIADRKREEASLMLRYVGVDDESTLRMVDTLIGLKADGPL